MAVEQLKFRAEGFPPDLCLSVITVVWIRPSDAHLPRNAATINQGNHRDYGEKGIPRRVLQNAKHVRSIGDYNRSHGAASTRVWRFGRGSYVAVGSRPNTGLLKIGYIDNSAQPLLQQ